MDIHDLENRVMRIEDKLEHYVRDDLYERRHGEAIERIVKLEAGDALLRSEFLNKFDTLNTTLTSLTVRIEKIATTRWQWIAGLAGAFVFGSGGLYVLLAAIHALR